MVSVVTRERQQEQKGMAAAVMGLGSKGRMLWALGQLQPGRQTSAVLGRRLLQCSKGYVAWKWQVTHYARTLVRWRVKHDLRVGGTGRRSGGGDEVSLLSQCCGHSSP